MEVKVESKENVYGFKINASNLDIEEFKANPVYIEAAIKPPLNELKIISEHYGIADEVINPQSH